MSRFPLLPLLLSFSTTLQSACLENKCTLDEYKNNDPVCKDRSKIKWGKLEPYNYLFSGQQSAVHGIAMHEFKGMGNKLNGMIYAALNYEENGIVATGTSSIYKPNTVDLIVRIYKNEYE